MARCQSCGLLCGIEHEVELQSIEASVGTGGEVDVSGTVGLVLNSACCADEVGQVDLEFSATVALEHKGGCEAAELDPEVDGEVEPEDRFTAADRHGKPIKSARYQRHFYGARVSFKVDCSACGAEASGEAYEEEQASSILN